MGVGTLRRHRHDDNVLTDNDIRGESMKKPTGVDAIDKNYVNAEPLPPSTADLATNARVIDNEAISTDKEEADKKPLKTNDGGVDLDNHPETSLEGAVAKPKEVKPKLDKVDKANEVDRTDRPKPTKAS